MPSRSTATLLYSLSISESFSRGARKLAAFFRRSEERHEPGPTLIDILKNNNDTKLLEYILLCFLDTGRSDEEVLWKALQFRRLHQLLYRATHTNASLSEQERQLTDDLKKLLRITTPGDLGVAQKIAATWTDLLLAGKEIGGARRKQLSFLLYCEATALRERIGCLSDRVDPYDMKAIYRLLPVLTINDEQVKTIGDLGHAIEKGKPLGVPILSFELSMKPPAFQKFVQNIGKYPALSPFLHVLLLQRRKLVPSHLLVAVSTLTRWLHADQGSPLNWIMQALECSTHESFAVNVGNALNSIQPLIIESGAQVIGTFVTGDFTRHSFTHWSNSDMLTRPFTEESEPSIEEIVSRCMHNDHLLGRLLANPTVYSTPGIVKKIAQNNHNLSIIQQIVSTRHLHTGPANTDVPLTLLRNSVYLSAEQIRVLISSCSIAQLQELLKNPDGIHPEVIPKIQTVLIQKSGRMMVTG